MMATINLYRAFVDKLTVVEGLPLLALRLYLAPIMLQAGWSKLAHFSETVAWFADPEYGLGLPAAPLLAGLATGTELIGGALLIAGLFTRLVSIPLFITMVVAMITVHAENGWLAIADASSWFADGTLYLDQSVLDAPEKLAAAKSILDTHGYIDWLTSSGNFVVLNNGIEFAATYAVMLLVLLFFGGGRFVSLDYWLSKSFAAKHSQKP